MLPDFCIEIDRLHLGNLNTGGIEEAEVTGANKPSQQPQSPASFVDLHPLRMPPEIYSNSREL